MHSHFSCVRLLSGESPFFLRHHCLGFEKGEKPLFATSYLAAGVRAKLVCYTASYAVCLRRSGKSGKKGGGVGKLARAF
jgi:hypothetical protein